MNAPDRFELFLLGDGEKKVTERVDTRVPNCSYFDFKKEDHTLGNLLCVYVGKNPAVEFNGYRVPHPLVAEFELRIQTDGSITPKEALLQCCRDLVAEFGKVSREFTKEYELAKMAGENGGE